MRKISTHQFVSNVAAVLLTVSMIAACGSSSEDRGRDCGREDSECSLAETASQVGFWIGAAVPPDVSDPRMDSVPTHFNSITAENAMKWGELAPQVGHYDFRQADALVDFAVANRLRVRGHTLVWGKYPGSGHPADLRDVIDSSPDPAATMREILTEHITTTVGRYAGRVDAWDVVNEPMAIFGPALEHNVFFETLGVDYIAEAFHLARAADPAATLFLNENLFAYTDAKARSLVGLIAGFLDEGVPIDGVGIQTHLLFAVPEAADFRGYLQEIADLGLVIELTEVDIAKAALKPLMRTGKPILEIQADAYHLLTAACVAVAGCQGITTWGINDAGTWLDAQIPFSADAPNEPLLLDLSMRPKPAYFAVRRAIAGGSDNSLEESP